MSTFRSRQFKKEDFTGLMKAEPRFEDLLTALNQASKLLESILNGGILVSDNVSAFWKTVEVTTKAAAPLWPATEFNSTLRRNPVGIFVAQALDITVPQSPVPVSLSLPAWTVGTGQSATVRITDVQGVQASKRYRVTFLVVGG